VSIANLEAVRDHLIGVVNEPHGTGHAAAVPGLEVAGKTGTAQVVGLQHTEDLDDEEIAEQHRDHAWFVAWAPARAPEIAIAVLLEHGGHGGSAAAPVAGKILKTWWAKRQAPLAPDEAPEGEPAPVVTAGAPAARPVVTAGAPAAAQGEGDRAAD